MGVGAVNKQDWLDRRPQPGETCVFAHGYDGLGQNYNERLVTIWKRDALLFDRVYARCLDPTMPPDIPPQLSFGVATVDQSVQSYDVNSAQMFAQAYQGMSIEQIEAHSPGLVGSIDFDRQMADEYCRIGVMGEWTYSARKPYFRQFDGGERLAYEGALNNIPLVSTGACEWEHIIAFREDPEASRKYRDLRLWLRSGLGAQSVEHATDIIGQKIEDYRWAIKKHGFETSLGTFTQLFDWKESRLAIVAGGIGAMLGGPIGAGIASGLMVAANIGTFFCERKLASKDISRGQGREIAILYEAQEKFGDKTS